MSAKNPFLRSAPALLLASAACLLPRLAAAEPPPVANPARGVVAYRIDARFDDAKKEIAGTETLTYENHWAEPITEVPFHLYLNGYQPGSAYAGELRADQPGFPWEERVRGGIELTRVEAEGLGDLTSSVSFPGTASAPGDRTVASVRLPQPVPAGGRVTFTLAFRSRLPSGPWKTGTQGDFVMGSQWFPKAGVFERGAWSAAPLHYAAEFFSDFGSYDVRLTLPSRYLAGATGREVGRADGSDGTTTFHYQANDVHDFAWTADPRYRVFTETYSGSGGPVEVRLLMQPEHVRQAERHLAIARRSLALFDRWFGPYPYGTLTIVDPEHTARVGPQEYPTLIVAGTSWLLYPGSRETERIIAHELSHQYFYAAAGNDETDDAWLDEGLAAYVEMKVLDSIYGPDRSLLEALGLTAGERGMQRFRYLEIPDADPPARPGFDDLNRTSYMAASYHKVAIGLLSLESVIGEEGVLRALRLYYERFKFGHPRKDDFLRVLEEAAGGAAGRVRPFEIPWLEGVQKLDYAVTELTASPVSLPGRKPGEPSYRSTVVVRRKGDFVVPTVTEVKFSDGKTVRETWDGGARDGVAWVRYTYDGPSRAVSAEIDPEHLVLLDEDLFNNSRTLAPSPVATEHVSNLWLFVTQIVSEMAAWLS